MLFIQDRRQNSIFNTGSPHKGWDCKDDWKRCDNPKTKLNSLNLVFQFGLFNYFENKEANLQFSGNYEYDVTDSVNSVKSSLKSHPLCITLYIRILGDY